jgi:hypothetical protein
MSNQHEQLFTEITPEQAAIVEGGIRNVTIGTIRSIKSGADGAGGSDEVFAVINGTRVRFVNPQSMSTGFVANFGAGANFSNTSPVTVSLFDQDGSNQANADFLGSFTVSNGTTSGTRRVSGSGSTYDVSFTAF